MPPPARDFGHPHPVRGIGLYKIFVPFVVLAHLSIILSITPPCRLYVAHYCNKRSHDYEQALVSLKLKKSVDAEGGRTFAVLIEGG